MIYYKYLAGVLNLLVILSIPFHLVGASKSEQFRLGPFEMNILGKLRDWVHDYSASIMMITSVAVVVGSAVFVRMQIQTHAQERLRDLVHMDEIRTSINRHSSMLAYNQAQARRDREHSNWLWSIPSN